jgi:signal peptidase I
MKNHTFLFADFLFLNKYNVNKHNLKKNFLQIVGVGLFVFCGTGA